MLKINNILQLKLLKINYLQRGKRILAPITFECTQILELIENIEEELF